MARRPKLTPVQIDQLRQADAAGVFTDGFHGKRIALTGTMSMDRSDIKAMISLLGATFDERPVRGTHFLVVGDTKAHGMTAKIRAAEALDIQILEEHEFAGRLWVPQVS